MKIFCFVVLLFINIIPTAVFSQSLEEEQVLLRVNYIQGEKIVTKMELIGNNIDPNSFSNSDVYFITINDKKIDIPIDIISQLVRLRRNVSYDTMTGGIQRKDFKILCRMAGLKIGRILLAQYLTYNDTPKIINNQMKSVYTKADNCLFRTVEYSPIKESSKISSAEIVSIFTTIKSIFNK